MPRYFLEVSYKGTAYSGFQVQENAHTVQGEIEARLEILLKQKLTLTGSSRTDSGVHAYQNYFHFDFEPAFRQAWIYNLNALLPKDIVIHSVREVADAAHCRFDAHSRSYLYSVYQFKNAFYNDRAFFYPYPLDLEKLNQAAELLKSYTNFSSFSKKNTQVKTFNCQLMESHWQWEQGLLQYRVTANRFLRGMVRALVATMLKVGRGTLSLTEFSQIIERETCGAAHFDAPAHGLVLLEVTL